MDQEYNLNVADTLTHPQHLDSDETMHLDDGHIPESDSNRTNVTDTQLDVELECSRNSETTDGSSPANQTSKTCVGSNTKPFQRPRTDDGPFDQGFTFARAKGSKALVDPKGSGRMPSDHPQDTIITSKPASWLADQSPAQLAEQQRSPTSGKAVATAPPKQKNPLNIPEAMFRSDQRQTEIPKTIPSDSIDGARFNDQDLITCETGNPFPRDAADGDSNSLEEAHGNAPMVEGIVLPAEGVESVRRGQSSNGQVVSPAAEERPSLDGSHKPQSEIQEKTAQLPQESIARIPAKVTKHKKSSKKSNTRRMPSDRLARSVEPGDPSQEDIMNVLLHKVQQDKLTCEAERKAHGVNAAELARLTEAYENLRNQLEAMKQQDQKQQDEISRQKQAIPGYQAKVKKLEDYVTGLIKTNDKMKAGAKSFKRLGDEVSSEHNELVNALEESRDAICQLRAKYPSAMASLRDRIKDLEHECRCYQQSIKMQIEVADSERQRSDLLEAKVSKIVEVQQKILETASGDRETMLAKVEQTCAALASNGSTNMSNSLEGIRTTIGQCMTAIESIAAEPDKKQEFVEDINVTICGYAKTMNDSLTQSIEQSKVLGIDTENFNSKIVAQLDTLVLQFQTEQKLAGEIRQLGDSKSKMQCQLQGLGFDLEQATKKNEDLTAELRNVSYQAVSLREELSTLKARPEQDPRLQSQVTSLERYTTKLQTEIRELRGLYDEQTTSVANYEREKDGMQLQVDQLKTQLHESNAAASADFELRKVEYEKDISLQFEEERARLQKAADLDVAVRISKKSELLRQANFQRDAANRRVTELEEQLKCLNSTHEVHRDDLKTALAELETSRADIRRLTERLQHLTVTHETQLSVVENAKSDQETQIENLEKRLSSVQADFKAYSDATNKKLVDMDHLRDGNSKGEIRCADLQKALAAEKADTEHLRGLISAYEIDGANHEESLAEHQNEIERLKEVTKKKEDELTEMRRVLADRVENGQHGGGTEMNNPTNTNVESESLELPNPRITTIRADAQDESQELPYDQIRYLKSTAQQESQELPYGRLESGTPVDDYLPMRSIMEEDGDQPAERTYPSFSAERRKVNRNHASQGTTRYYVEESQLYRRSVTETSPPELGADDILASLPFGHFNLPSATAVPQADLSFDRIQELTSPVGDTRVLFPPTPVPQTPRSGNGHGKGDHVGPGGQEPAYGGSGTPTQNGNKFKAGDPCTDRPNTDTKPMLKKDIGQGLKRKCGGVDGPTSNISRSRKKVGRVSTQDLGPMIGDSQSPGSGSLSKQIGQARKSLRRKSGDKFTRRFNQLE